MLTTIHDLLTNSDIIKILALDADICIGPGALMITVSCIQAKHSESRNCRNGIAIQPGELMRGLDVEEKGGRGTDFRRGTRKCVIGITSLDDLSSAIHGYDRKAEGSPAI